MPKPRMPSRLTVRRRVVKAMTALGNYKPEYDDLIDIYVDMLVQYQLYQSMFSEAGYRLTENYTNKAGATNLRKTPIVLALESLRRDIIIYSDRLRLNPKSDMGEVVGSQEPTDQFAAMLKAVEASV